MSTFWAKLQQNKSLILPILILVDGILDIIVGILYYSDDAIAFFVMTLCIIFLTAIVNTTIIVHCARGWPDSAIAIAALFVIPIPLTVSLPLCAYLASNKTFLQRKLLTHGMELRPVYFGVGYTVLIDSDFSNTT